MSSSSYIQQNEMSPFVNSFVQDGLSKYKGPNPYLRFILLREQAEIIARVSQGSKPKSQQPKPEPKPEPDDSSSESETEIIPFWDDDDDGY